MALCFLCADQGRRRNQHQDMPQQVQEGFQYEIQLIFFIFLLFYISQELPSFCPPRLNTSDCFFPSLQNARL